jgi:hypothetical protein
MQHQTTDEARFGAVKRYPTRQIPKQNTFVNRLTFRAAVSKVPMRYEQVNDSENNNKQQRSWNKKKYLSLPSHSCSPSKSSHKK